MIPEYFAHPHITELPSFLPPTSDCIPNEISLVICVFDFLDPIFSLKLAKSSNSSADAAWRGQFQVLSNCGFFFCAAARTEVDGLKAGGGLPDDVFVVVLLSSGVGIEFQFQNSTR